jgi:biotin synthase
MIKTILDNVLSGKKLDFKEAILLLGAEACDMSFLMCAANITRQRYRGNKMDLCALMNAKSGFCPEDCKFCAQSSKYKTDCKTYPLAGIEKIVKAAKKAKRFGAGNFCIVISGKGPSREEFDRIKKAIVRIKKEVGIDVDCSLGKLDIGMVKELKELGIDRYNHNLETCADFYKNICTTHSHQNRVDMVTMLKNEGMNPCCGGIIGLGETPEERIKLAFRLKELGIKCVPVNIFNPRKGTPLEKNEPVTPMEIIKTIAVFRLILPEATIKVAGGREHSLRDLQSLAFMSGANGMIIGGYLTTRGRSVKKDLQMVRDLGFETSS